MAEEKLEQRRQKRQAAAGVPNAKFTNQEAKGSKGAIAESSRDICFNHKQETQIFIEC